MKNQQGRAVVTLVILWTTTSSEFRVGQGRLLLGVVAVRVRGQGLQVLPESKPKPALE